MKKNARQAGIAMLGLLATAALVLGCGGVIPAGDAPPGPAAGETVTLQIKLGYVQNLLSETLPLTLSALTVTARNPDATGDSVAQTVWQNGGELRLEPGACYYPAVLKYLDLPQQGSDKVELCLTYSGRCDFEGEQAAVSGKFTAPLADLESGSESGFPPGKNSSHKIFFSGSVHLPPDVPPLPLSLAETPPASIDKTSIVAPTDVLGICVEIDLLN